MFGELLLQHGNYLVRRLRVDPGAATPWHRDPCQRITVVLSGDQLLIEFRDDTPSHAVAVHAWEVEWQEAGTVVHRAVNVGKEVYEEITTFFLESPEADPQPVAA